MKARWVVVASLTAVALVAGGCSSSSSGGSSGGAEFHVLDITALSGPLASIGTPETQATKAAVNYLNSLGGLSGRKIVLDVKDDQSDPSKAVSLVQQALTSGKKPDLVLPGVTSNETVALLPVLARSKVVSIATTGSAEITNTAKYPLSFGASFQPTDGPESMATYLAKQNYKTVGILRANDAFGASWFSNLSKSLAVRSLKAVSVTYDPTAIDLSPELGKLESEHPDVIVAEGFGAPVAAIYAARVKLGNYAIPLVADTTISAGNPWKAAGNPAAFQNSVEQAYAVQEYKPAATQRPAVQTMLTWVRKLGPLTAAISLYAGNWDLLQTAKAAVAKAGSQASTKLAQAMESLSAADAQWTQNGGAPPGYTSAVHFAVSTPQNFIYIKPGPLTDGMITAT